MIDPSWYKELTGAGQDQGQAIAFDPAGNLAIAGSSAGFTTPATNVLPGALGGTGAFIAKFTAGGSLT